MEPDKLSPALVEKNPAGKINYIDHLKVLMIVLVILHHTFITYGARGRLVFPGQDYPDGRTIPN